MTKKAGAIGKKVLVICFLFMGICAPVLRANPADFCDHFKGVKKIWWDGAEAGSNRQTDCFRGYPFIQRGRRYPGFYEYLEIFG